MNPITPNSRTLKGRWEQMLRKRNSVTLRAEQASALTIPSILPPDSHTENSELPTPYQALGARAVNTLSSKFLLALFPPNTSFFKLTFDDLVTAQLEEDQVNVQQVIKDLAAVERVVVTSLEQTKLRSVMAQAFKHLIVTGNGVVKVDPEGQFRFFSLRHFVVERSPEGDVLVLIIKEDVSPQALPQDVQEACFSENERTQYSTSHEKTAELYTVMERTDGKYRVYQECNGKHVPDSDGTYPLEAPLFVTLRWTSITDEEYGRGMVDEYLGDLIALDALSRDLLKASSIAAKVIFAVDPNSHITPAMVAKAKSGDALRGNAMDVGTIGVDKLQDFNIALERLRDIQRDLSEAFLMNASVQRDAERVTAEEIRYLAQDLEDTLGGVYSVLAQDLQGPLIRRILSVLQRKRLIPKLPANELKIQITTGLEALGRGHDVNKMMTFLQIAGQVLGPEQLQQRMDIQGILNALSIGIGINVENMILSEEEVQQKMQAAQAQQMAAQTVPGMAQEMMKQQGGPPNG